MNRPELVGPLLRVRHSARTVGEGALISYYTNSAFHLARLEEEMERLDRELAGLRMTLQAIRSRGEEPTS